MTKEEKELFTKIIMAGPMFMIGGPSSSPLKITGNNI